MKKIYTRPEIEAVEVRAKDIITLSDYMTPEIDFGGSIDVNPVDGGVDFY